MKIQIKVNEKTSPIIQKLLFERGYSWEPNEVIAKYLKAPFLFAWPDRSLAYGEYGRDYREKGSIYIDAATQLGELLELLDTREITVKDVLEPDVTNHFRGGPNRDGIISADKTYIQVGCSRVSKEKVKEVYEKMFS